MIGASVRDRVCWAVADCRRLLAQPVLPTLEVMLLPHSDVPGAFTTVYPG